MKPIQRLYHAAREDALDLEDRERYRPGGYHPVHFNDYLGPENRFLVIHKLGWGVSSTVWLCYDEKSRHYKSVKIMTAEESVEECPELGLMKALADADYKELRDNYIAIPSYHFWIDGPNGHHLCFVSDLHGPSLFMNHPYGIDVHTPESLTDLAFQVTKGLRYLHQKGICHGDLRPSNILMQLDMYKVTELTGRQVSRYLGLRQYMPLETLSGKDPKPHGPDYLVFPASLDVLQKRCPTGRVAIVDFNDSFHSSDPPKSARSHRQYAAPELIFTDVLGGPSQDIWSLACTIYELKTQEPLFSEYQSYTSLIRQMEVWFGPLPAGYRQSAKAYLEGERPDSTQALSNEEFADTDQLASLSAEEERQLRKEFIGKSSWSNPLQASLGLERDCSVYVKYHDGYTGYTSSDNTESDSDESRDITLDWTSEDECAQEDIYAQADLIFEEIEEDAPSPVELYGDTQENSDSLTLETTEDCESQSGQDHEEKPLAIPPKLNEGSVTTSEQEKGGSETESATSEMIPQEVLAKRDADKSSEARDTKRQRMSPSPSPLSKKSEWVKKVVSMPREEVILLHDLLSRMFKHDPKERLDIDAVLNHDFWGDRRYKWPRDRGNDIEDIPDPISSRTRSHTLKVSQTGQETEPSQDLKSDEPVEGEPTDDVKG